MSGSLSIKWSQRGGNNIHVQGIDDVQQTSHINERVPCLRVCEPKGGSVVVVVSRLSAMIAHIARDEFWDPSSYVFKKSFSNLKPNMSASSKTTLPFSNWNRNKGIEAFKNRFQSNRDLFTAEKQRVRNFDVCGATDKRQEISLQETINMNRKKTKQKENKTERKQNRKKTRTNSSKFVDIIERSFFLFLVFCVVCLLLDKRLIERLMEIREEKPMFAELKSTPKMLTMRTLYITLHFQGCEKVVRTLLEYGAMN